jgi:hypothetical protein
VTAAAVLGDAFERALGATRPSQTTLRIAGRPVEIRIAGDCLARETLRPFAHLVGPFGNGERPALSIDAWDEAETGVACPIGSAAWNEPARSDDDGGVADGSRAWTVDGGTFRASGRRRFLVFDRAGSISLFDRESRRIIACRARAGDLSGHARIKPFALHLATWLAGLGVHELHAALVGRAGIGALLAGASGAGKSTSTMACLHDGLDFLGDDIVAIEQVAGGSFAGHSLFGGVCLGPHDLTRFAVPAAHLAGAVRAAEKWCLFPHETAGFHVPSRVEVGAVLLLRGGRDRTRLDPARRTDVFLALATNAIGTVVPRPGRAAMDTVGRLAERVPGFWLDLGSDAEETPGVIRGLLANLGGG